MCLSHADFPPSQCPSLCRMCVFCLPQGALPPSESPPRCRVSFSAQRSFDVAGAPLASFKDLEHMRHSPILKKQRWYLRPAVRMQFHAAENNTCARRACSMPHKPSPRWHRDQKIVETIFVGPGTSGLGNQSSHWLALFSSALTFAAWCISHATTNPKRRKQGH